MYYMAQLSQYVGIASGILTGVSLIPQLIKVVREKKSESVSTGMLIVLLAGLSGWIWYGILKKDYPIIITNAFSLLTNISILILSSIYSRRKAS
jgi:MtN3 and saliva related transmembrane protein